MSARERQALCRARKKAMLLAVAGADAPPLTRHWRELLPVAPKPAGLASAELPVPLLPNPTSHERGIEKADVATERQSPARREANSFAEQLLQSLPPAVAKRLQSLIEKHEAGADLTADELAEARGLLDIAEYFVVQRMRKQLAA